MKKRFSILAGIALFLVSCNDGTTSGGSVASLDSTAIKKEEKERRNKNAAMANIDATQKLDAEQSYKDFAQDYTEYGDGTNPSLKGLDSNKAMFKSFLSSLEHLKGSNIQAVADGDQVMVYGDWEGKFKSDFMGMKTAGKPFKFKDIDIFKFNDDGKIVEHRTVQNSLTIMAQMGIQPPKQ